MHLVAICTRYPEFKFVVPALRVGLRSGIVQFAHGQLDTRAAGYTHEEAEAIHAALQSMRGTPPVYARDIQVRVLEEPKHDPKPLKERKSDGL